jgi:histidinol-phosphate phosphatase family protein
LKIVVVTNQRGIALGRMSEEALADIHDRMHAAVIDAGGRIDAIYHCPHHAGCRCRKPEVGMFEDAARDCGLDLRHTAVIGDQPYDMIAAERIGALQVRIGDAAAELETDYAARDLEDAAHWLLD